MSIKLSEAMRLGSMLHPQGFGEGYRDPTACEPGKTCGMAAALEAVGIVLKDYHPSQFPAEWKALTNAAASCPECGRETVRVEACIYHLNDCHHWPREKIADWLESVEARLEAAQDEALCLSR